MGEKESCEKKVKRNVWIFQGNPLRYRVYDALCDEGLEEDTWLVSRFRNEIQIGDIGLIWKARKRSGIYAIGEITSNPQLMCELPESRKYWINESDRDKEELRVLINYKLKLRLTTALLKKELQEIPGLCNMAILKQSQGTNFRVESSEWRAIQEVLKRKFAFEII